MKKIRTHYDNLKISRDASQEEIKRAYRKLIHQYHPDKNKNSNAERISQILNDAYQTLSNPISKKEHDDWIRQKYDNYTKQDDSTEWRYQHDKKEREDSQRWKNKKDQEYAEILRRRRMAAQKQQGKSLDDQEELVFTELDKKMILVMFCIGLLLFVIYSIK